MKRIYLLFLIITCPTVWAFKMTPMITSIHPAEKEYSTLFTLINDKNEKAAIQLSIAHRKMDAFGKEKHPLANQLFQVFPEQLILNPNEKRIVKVTWISKEIPKNELPFRIISEQLPIDLSKKKKKTGINILMRYIGALYIAPAKENPNIKIETYSFDSKKKQLKLVIKNNGNTHKVLLKPKLILSQGKSIVELTGIKKLKGLISENVLAQSKRIFYIPWPKELNSKDLFKVSLHFE